MENKQKKNQSFVLALKYVFDIYCRIYCSPKTNSYREHVRSLGRNLKREVREIR